MLKTRISVPARVSAGALVEVKTLISHPMESGFRLDSRGQTIPRNILVAFLCTYNGRTVLRANLHPAIAANPYLAFTFRADVSGTLDFVWTDQHGVETRAQRELRVDD